MITSPIILKSFTENRLKDVVRELIWLECLNYEWEKYQTNTYVTQTECEKYVREKLISPSLDVKMCLRNLDDQKSKLHYNNRYDKNLITKKIIYFRMLSKRKDNIELYNLAIKINWYVLRIQDSKEWNDFFSLLTGEKIIHVVINTRPDKGLKPYKVSSKIIYNRNG